MEGSFWNQHSNLQSIHSFVFTNTNQSAIAQTKEFMALNLRRVVAEVDQKAQMWCASALNNSEDISEDALLEHWLEYYRDQLLVTGKTMISKMYADVRSKMGTEYSRYPEHARVLKLAVFYTSRHLRQQEGAMQHHLRDYVERKLRELMERKRNVIVLSADTQSNLSKRPLKYATIIIESDNNSALPNGINKNNMEDILSSMVTRGFLCVVQHNTNFSSSELDWTFSPDMANYPMKLLNRIGEASYTLVQVGEHLCTNEFQCSSNVQCTEDGIYVHISRSCRPSLPSTIEQYKMLLFSFAKSISHVFHSRHPSISQEVRGKVGIELTKFLLSTLPILIYLDCLNVLDIEIGPVCISRKLMDNSMETQTSLFVDLAICLVVKYQILPLGSFLPVLIALFRDKTSAFYEHSKGMVAISWLMPQGLLFLLARLVIVSSAAISPSFRTEQFWDGSLVDKVRACEDPLKLLNLMVILVDKCSL
ncbi:hypothetical protein EON65_26735 [archaeon]|nr:MAG: hypothetical protein EON65_26735 [archaeon]